MFLMILVLSITIFFLWWVREKNIVRFEIFSDLKILFLIIVQTLTLTLQIGWTAWNRLWVFFQPYNEFISGTIGFGNQNKTAEYYALYTIVVVFVLLLFFIAKIYEVVLDNRIEVRQGVLKLSFYAIIPSIILAGQSLRMSELIYLMKLSSIFVILSIATVYILRILINRSIIEPAVTFEVGAKIMLAILFLGLSDIGFSLLLSRVKYTSYHVGILSVIVLACCLAFYLINKTKQLITFRRGLDLFFFASQLGVPFLFSVFASPPVFLQNGLLTIFHYRPILYIFLLGLFILSFVDIFLRFKRERYNNLLLISPWVLLAILIYLQSGPLVWPGISPDEYHSGEFYLPWWLFNKYGYLPFVNYQPARGLINYVPGFLSWLFGDNTASGQSLVWIQHSALYVFVAFWSLRLIVGDLVAFLSVSTIFNFTGEPLGGLIVAISSTAILYQSLSIQKPIKSLWLWLSLSIVTSLFTVAEGATFVIGTLPLAIYILFQSYYKSRKSLAISFGILVVLALLFSFTTNLGQIGLSAMRYLFEQSAVNDVANGIAWKYPGDINNMVTSGILWQFVRFSWLLIIVPITVLLLRARNNARDRDNVINMLYRQFFLIALLIMSFLLIPRAAGRIDPVLYSRLGQTSIGLIVCALPMILLPATKDQGKKMVIILALALIFGVIGNQEITLSKIWRLDKYVLYEPPNTTSGNRYYLENIGQSVTMSSPQIKRQVEIKKVLDQILTPQETYYDVTNHNTDYLFQGRPSPVTDTAFYNAPVASQQIRITQQLESKKIPVALISAENILHDGGVLPLRAFIVYRYLLENYLPFQDDTGYIWMIRKGEEGRLAKTNYRVGTPQEQIELLNTAFGQSNLYGLPAAWGNSMNTLASKLSNPLNLMKIGIISAQNNLTVEDGHWAVAGKNLSIVLKIPGSVKGDFVYLAITQNNCGGTIQLFWKNRFVSQFRDDQSFRFDNISTHFLIPVSAFPSWELSPSVDEITLNFYFERKCNFEIQNLVVYTRVSK